MDSTWDIAAIRRDSVGWLTPSWSCNAPRYSGPRRNKVSIAASMAPHEYILNR